MISDLPSKTYQRRKLFRPTYEDINYAYNIVNRHVFKNQLRKPEIRLGIIPKCWGTCVWMPEKQESGSHTIIRLSDKWFCQQWCLNTLAHEMVHQWQWDVHRWEVGGRIYEDSGAHGPSFFAWRDEFAYYGLNLKVSHGQRRWFRHQDFTKC
jgi:hypothetical protein